MKHNIKQITRYENVYGREVIEYTCINNIEYSIVSQYGEVKGYVKFGDEWKELSLEESTQEYERILKVIQYEVHKELKSNEQKNIKKETKQFQSAFVG